MKSLSATGRDYGLDNREVKAIADYLGIPTVIVNERLRCVPPEHAPELQTALAVVQRNRRYGKAAAETRPFTERD